MVKQKTIIEVDVMLLDKTKFREYTKRDGTVAKIATLEVVETDKLDVVVNKDNQPVKGNGSILNKVGFVTEQQTKDERASKVKSKILGNAKRWVAEDSEPASKPSKSEDDYGAIDSESIPF